MCRDNYSNKALFIKRHHEGFTLIEILVAITILAIIAVMGWRGLDAIIRARTNLNQDLEQSRGAQICLVQMENDLVNIITDAQMSEIEKMSFHNQQLLIKRVLRLNNQASQVQVVAYRLHRNEIKRRASLPTLSYEVIEADWASMQNNTDTFPEVTLQKNVQQMTFRIWNAKEKNWRIPDIVAPQSAPPQPGSITEGPQSLNEVTGVEISIQIQELSNPILKIFLVGSV